MTLTWKKGESGRKDKEEEVLKKEETKEKNNLRRD
jgi:hypothetical protein